MAGWSFATKASNGHVKKGRSVGVPRGGGGGGKSGGRVLGRPGPKIDSFFRAAAK
jgi:hypothetical protein